MLLIYCIFNEIIKHLYRSTYIPVVLHNQGILYKMGSQPRIGYTSAPAAPAEGERLSSLGNAAARIQSNHPTSSLLSREPLFSNPVACDWLMIDKKGRSLVYWYHICFLFERRGRRKNGAKILIIDDDDYGDMVMLFSFSFVSLLKQYALQ